jgi:prepilin-type N-terminal cleavage/methylation domain-containing protein
MRRVDINFDGRAERMNTERPAGCAGFSLVELLIALSISGIATSAAIHLVSAYGLRVTSQQSTMVSNQELRLGLDVLCSEVRLAGAGLLGAEAPFTKAERDEVEFFANLSGSSTTLTQNVEIGRQELPVEEGAGWSKGKQLLLCTAERCAWNRLAADGRKQQLTLVTSVTERLPMHSAAFLLNRVRYYLKRDDDGTMRLMREVDGVASTLLADVEVFQLHYVDRTGVETTDAKETVRLRVTIQVGSKGSMLTREVAIRA